MTIMCRMYYPRWQNWRIPSRCNLPCLKRHGIY